MRGGAAGLVVRARRHLGLVAQPAVQPLAEAGRDEEHVRARLGRTLEAVLLEANVHLHGLGSGLGLGLGCTARAAATRRVRLRA